MIPVAVRIALASVLLCFAAAGAQDISPANSRLGMNLAGPADWTTEHPFVDVFRMSRKWISQRKGESWGKGPELARDQHGWITRLDADCFAETPVLTGGQAPSGEYVLIYEGEGTIEIRGAKKIISAAPGRIAAEVDGRKGGLFIQLRATNERNYVRNIRMLMPGHEKTHAAEPFNPVFLAKWRGFNTFRFMDWMHTNGSKIVTWADNPKVDDANWMEKGIPPEVMCDLCNRLKSNAWFCMPHKADDAYVREFAKLVKARLDPSLKAYVEYSNEVWNYGFEQTRYAGDQGLALKLAERHHEACWRYCAQRSVEIFRIWEEVFGGRERLVRVMATQMVAAVSEGKLGWKDAARQCDALAVAPYIQFSIPRQDKGKGLTSDAVQQWTVEQILDHMESKSLPGSIKAIQEQKKIADKYGLALIAYEAGQHAVGIGGAENDEPLTRLLTAANRHPRMGAIYTQYLDGWKSAGGELCCIFSSTGGYTKWGSWGLIENIDEETPKLKAVLQWNAKNRR